MDYTEKIKKMKETGKSPEYILGYLDGKFEGMLEMRDEIENLTKRIANQQKAKKILGD